MTKESGEYIVSPFKPAAPLAEESQPIEPTIVDKENPNETTVEEEESKDHSSQNH